MSRTVKDVPGPRMAASFSTVTHGLFGWMRITACGRYPARGGLLVGYTRARVPCVSAAAATC